MADQKISALSSASTPLAGTEVLPIVQSASTVKVAVNDLTVKNIRSNATSGILQITGTGASTTRVMTVPDANFNVAITNTAQTFTGAQTFSSNPVIDGGTANGVAYLNASKVLTTGSLLVFDGTNLGLGNAPKAWAGAGASALQRGSTSLFEYGTHNSIVGSNYYFDGSANRYINNGKATYYQQFDGGHTWVTAAAGSANDPSSFSTTMALNGAGDLTISGSTATKASGTTWANPSDIRLKNNVSPYTGGLNQLLQIQVKTWEYNGKGGTQIGAKGLGVIADEALLVIPDSVDTYSAKLNKDDKENTDIKRFDATEITWLLVNSVKELSAKINMLQIELDTLKT
jgi:hypothetical protein